MGKILSELKKRSKEASGQVKIELKLYNLADELETKARNHLKRIRSILPQFDIHDEKHSEKVVSNIEKLLGENTISQLSSYELFLLHLSSFFHDCAMAPSDWEINVLKLTEGTDKFTVEEKSLANDLKKPYKYSDAKQIIREKKNYIYGSFEPEVKEWIFSPSSEDALVNYLASTLREYQNHRNGYSKQIQKVSNQEEFEELNTFIRRDFIRATHHQRIEKYVENLGEYFENSFEQPAWGKQLANHLASICRSHGEDISYLKELSQTAEYYGNESTNLQMVGMLLRLGDIIHFSFDRAPIELRNSHLFESEFSFLQWALKSSGVNYSIENGKISFRAYCEKPNTYFKLHKYLDWIEAEIQNYFKLERSWPKSYIPNLQDKIDRKNINHDENTFLPRRGLSFTLDQAKIIDLLMGVGLYKDKFACLRELYQNSLDACRCMLAESKSIDRHTTGNIQFSLERTNNNTYLCCLDNGIGMTKEIIENYLLKIGESYYKSSEFFKSQAQWGGSFTPTSQFGIGILSCFMIGNKIEIVTKTRNGNYVSCSIDGPHENFYYRNTSQTEKEKVIESGTLVKIQLTDETIDNISDEDLEKLYLLTMGKPNHFPDKFSNYKSLYKNWNNHLYQKINSFVKVIPDNIALKIKTNNGQDLPIVSKPVLLNESDEFTISDEDREFLDYLIDYKNITKLDKKFSDIQDLLETYKIDITDDSIQYRTKLTLPKPGIIEQDYNVFHTYPHIDSSGLCIDGVAVKNSSINLKHHFTKALCRDGILNFVGKNKPSLTVDRTSLVEYPEKCEQSAKNITEKLLKKLISLTKKHISKNEFEVGNDDYELLWKFIFDKIGYADTIFISELASTEYGEIEWPNITEAVNEKLSIKSFLDKEYLSFQNFNLSKFDALTERLILVKLLSANEIDIEEEKVECKKSSLDKNLSLHNRNERQHYKLLVKADRWRGKYSQYDIVSNFDPLVSQQLFELIDSSGNNRTRLVHKYTNGLSAFFRQDPVLVHQSLGLYHHDSAHLLGNEQNCVYNFKKKRGSFQLNAINNKLIQDNINKRYAIFAFINPRKLNESEKKALERYKEEDPVYYEGVKNGWSILATGNRENDLLIRPGFKSRTELVSELPNSFWENKEIEYTFPDGQRLERSE